MAQPRRPDATCQAAVNAVAEHGSVSAAARALHLPDATLRRQYLDGLERGLKPGMAPAPPVPTVAEQTIREPLASFEEAWAQWQHEIGMMRERYQGPCSVEYNAHAQHSVAHERIVVLPDLHVPYHEPQMLAEFLEREQGADRCICIGDLGDSYALSRFTKYERMPYRDEWAQVTLVMQTLSEAFPRVDVIIGNHDARLEKQLRDRLSEDMVDAVRFLTGGVLCPITAMARRFPNVHIAKHTTPSGHEVDWFFTVGDAWLGHPETFSRVPGAALRKTEEWLADNERSLGLERYRLIVMGHTHAYAAIPWHADQLLVESGCLCKGQGYMTSPRIGGRPQRRGYLTLEQVDGRTDLNSVRFRCFDWQEAVA